MNYFLAAAGSALWMLGVVIAINLFRTKPRTMKQVAGDNSIQIQTGGEE